VTVAIFIFTKPRPGASNVEHAAAWRADLERIAEHGDRQVALDLARQLLAEVEANAPNLDDYLVIVLGLSADQLDEARSRGSRAVS
jgi:hypothetical protein